MLTHISLPGVALHPTAMNAGYLRYLQEWREQAIQKVDDGDVAASTCFQGTLIDLVETGRLTHDWLGVLDAFLLDHGLPLAYSKKYGERLYGFEDQWRQVSIHAIHVRWWIECVIQGAGNVDHGRYAQLIVDRKQAADGLIYDHDISPTVLRHRMKTELTMSMALAVEVLRAGELLSQDLSDRLTASMVDAKKCPPTGYMSTEYYRLQALNLLGKPELFPVGIEVSIESCARDLDVGYCDFAMDSKFDAYMGTPKRTARDKPIHSPLTACHVSALIGVIASDVARETIQSRLLQYACHLSKRPMDIPAFQMRDVPIAFGADKTPIEVVCASHLIGQCTK